MAKDASRYLVHMLEAIDNVAADKFFHVGVPRQVQLEIPLPQRCAIGVQLRKLCGRQLDVVTRQHFAQRLLLVGGCHGTRG